MWGGGGSCTTRECVAPFIVNVQVHCALILRYSEAIPMKYLCQLSYLHCEGKKLPVGASRAAMGVSVFEFDLSILQY